MNIIDLTPSGKIVVKPLTAAEILGLLSPQSFLVVEKR